MTVEEALRRKKQLQHKRKVLGETVGNLRQGFAVKNSDMDIEQLIAYSQSLLEHVDHEIRLIQSAVADATKDIEVTY